MPAPIGLQVRATFRELAQSGGLASARVRAGSVNPLTLTVERASGAAQDAVDLTVEVTSDDPLVTAERPPGVVNATARCRLIENARRPSSQPGFSIRARQSGLAPRTAALRVRFASGGVDVGGVDITLQVDPGAPSGRPNGTIGFPLNVAPAPLPPPDLIVRVTPDPTGAAAFSLETSEDNGVTFTGRGSAPHPIGPVTAASPAWRVALDRLLRTGVGPQAEVRAIGHGLWASLPAPFRGWMSGWVPASGRAHPSMLVLTRDPSFPWELVWPDGAATSWGRSYAVGRWEGTALPGDVRVELAQVFAATLADEADRRERDALERHLGPGAGAVNVPNVLSFKGVSAGIIVSQLMTVPPPQLFHFRLHGSPTSLAVPRLGRARQAETVDAASVAPGLFAAAALPPLIFINACATSGASPIAQTWPSALAASGAAAYVLTMWAVDSGKAPRAAELFYEAVADGASLGEGLRRVREATDVSTVAGGFGRNPTPLAYVLYGHPDARLIPRLPVLP